MALERFTLGATRGFSPKVSIRARGAIGFNQGAVKRFELSKYRYAILFYDRDAKLIAIKPTNDEQEEGLLKLRFNKKMTDASIAAKAFLDYFAINYNKTKRFDVEWDEDFAGILIEEGKARR